MSPDEIVETIDDVVKNTRLYNKTIMDVIVETGQTKDPIKKMSEAQLEVFQFMRGLY